MKGLKWYYIYIQRIIDEYVWKVKMIEDKNIYMQTNEM